MLIDLYERPYSPEAPKSRAFIDKIFSLSGPDGGVVGGEDGVSTQRPLKDGGREAWNMIRRLRQKGWQRAGLDPHKLWTEKAQMQAGLAPVDEYGLTDPNSPNESARTPAAIGTPRRPPAVDRQPTDDSETFYNTVRSQSSSHLASSVRPHQASSATVSATGTPPKLSTPSLSHSPTQLNRALDTIVPDTSSSSSGRMPQLNVAPVTATQQAAMTATTRPTTLPFMDPAPSNGQSMGVAPTPPSMVDPNLNFDWDQWDAVFGQHLPVADELMELDPVMGLELGDLGNVRLGGRPGGFGDIPGP